MIEDARAIDLLLERLTSLRAHPDYATIAPGMNWIAYEACCCIEGLIRQGAQADVQHAIDELAARQMAEVRDAVKRSLRFEREGR